MKTGLKGLLAGLLTLFCNPAIYAADTTITVNGKVIASACTTGANATYNIDLGQDHKESDLASASSYTGFVTQDVVLSDCPAGTNTITATFSGTPDTSIATHYANSSGTGYARNVAVQLQNRTTASNVGNGSVMSVSRNASNQAVFPLQARLFSFRGGATAGAVTVAVTMNITYN